MGLHLHAAEHSLLAAAQLADKLSCGWRPPALPSPIVLQPSESMHAASPATLLHHTGAEVSYQQNFFAFGGPVLFLATAAGSMVANARARQRAEASAREQWRVYDSGMAWFTNRRIALQGHSSWTDLWYADVRASFCDADGILLYFADRPPYKLGCPSPEWHFVLFRFLAYGEIVTIDLPEELRSRAAAAGHALPPPRGHARQLPQ